MKLNSALSAVLIAGFACAEDTTSAAEQSTSVPELPTFTPTNLKAPFLEQFNGDWKKLWKPSHAKKDLSGSEKKEEEEWVYVGEWTVEEPYKYKGMEGDLGLVAKNPAAHHAISAKFPQKIDTKGKTLVVQYEVKLQQGLECGGAYMKLLRDNKALHQEELSNTTPYVIMFGPDKCGSNNKVHFIFNHKNPKTGKYEEKHLSSPPSANIVKTTELYTLVVHPNNTYVIKQNGDEVKTGSLLEDFSPSVNPPAEIDDPKDTRPDDWVTQARIPDPEATKQEDWDEDAPFEIVNEEATMPEDWLEDEPLTIPDPEAKKPEDWIDEDGDWIPPTVANPKCAEVSGCGPWKKPMKSNPDYKGKWSAPYIDNPDYKGPWAPRKIKNPDFFEDKTPANFEPMGAIAFELWTMQGDILFDNIYIGHSVEDAEKLAAETFKLKHAVEKALADADLPKPDESKPKSPLDLKFLEDPIRYVREKLDLFLTIAQKDPIQAVKFVPEVAGGFAAVVVTLIAAVVALVSLGSSSPAVQKTAKDVKDKAKESAQEAKDQVTAAAASGAEAVATGTEKAKAEVSKRTTRSQS